MSFDAKPIPVDKPPVTTISHAKLMSSMERTIKNHAPHTTTCSTFLPIISRLATVVGSCRMKWMCIMARSVLQRYENMNHRLTTVERRTMLTLRLSRLMKLVVNIFQHSTLRLNTSAAQ